MTYFRSHSVQTRHIGGLLLNSNFKGNDIKMECHDNEMRKQPKHSNSNTTLPIRIQTHPHHKDSNTTLL